MHAYYNQCSSVLSLYVCRRSNSVSYSRKGVHLRVGWLAFQTPQLLYMRLVTYTRNAYSAYTFPNVCCMSVLTNQQKINLNYTILVHVQAE